MRLLSGSNGSDWPGVVVSGTTATFEEGNSYTFSLLETNESTDLGSREILYIRTIRLSTMSHTDLTLLSLCFRTFRG